MLASGLYKKLPQMSCGSGYASGVRLQFMIIWLVRDLEPIPSDQGGRRLMRMGLLAEALAARGHHTRWFTSSFDHYRKMHRSPRRQEDQSNPNLTISVLPAPGYRRNISFARIKHNRAFARAFLRTASAMAERPDIIVADLPTTEAASAAVAFGRASGVSTILSVRDLWPDFFAHHLPPAMRPFAHIALFWLEREARYSCAQASSLVGISPEYLNWAQAKGTRESTTDDGVYPLGYAPRPLADEANNNANLERLGIVSSAKVVAFVGSWGHTYDLKLLLETARCLSSRSDIQIVVAGDGPQTPILRKHFAAIHSVCLPGWINANDIAALLRRADVGLLPYKRNAPQGWPNKAFEYMAYGAYQIATLPGELQDLYRQTGTGLVVSHPNPAEFAQAITIALDDPQIAQDRARRLKVFEQNFHADLIYKQFVDHIERIARQRRG